MVGQVAQRVDAIDLHQPTLADDRHAVAAALDLAEDVARQEDAAAVRDPLPEQREECLLDERIQSRRWLVEQQKFGLVLQRRDQADLLLVALRVFAESAARVEVEALDQLSLVGAIDSAAEIAEVLERLAAGQPVVQREFAGQVAEALVDRRRVRRATRCRRRRPCRWSAG